MRTLLPLSLLLVAPSAHAFGLGTSLAFSQWDYWTYAPTLDLLFDPVIVQLHLGQTLDRAFDNELYLGANAHVTVAELDVNNWLTGVVQPGGAITIYDDPTQVLLAGAVRVGAETGGAARFGGYLVPYLGVRIDDGDVEALAGGGVQIAVAFDL